MELAAPKTTDAYEWRTYTGARGTNLTTTNRKRTAMLRDGSRFGVRPASRGDQVRLITEEHGPTIVFSVSQTVADGLIKKSRAIRGAAPRTRTPATKPIPQPARAKPETPAQVAQNATQQFARQLEALTHRHSREYLLWCAATRAPVTAATLTRWQRSRAR